MALAVLPGGAGTAAAAPSLPAGAANGGEPATTGSTRALTRVQRQARRRALRRCRQARHRGQRKRCRKRVKARFRRVARRQAAKPVPPPAATAVHDVLITDTTTKPIQLSYFIPVETMRRDESGRIIAPEVVPTTLTIKRGEALRFVWDRSNQHHSHTVSPNVYPRGVNRFDFSFMSAPVHGDISFQRTFRVPGFYRFICGLHPDTQLLDLTVTP